MSVVVSWHRATTLPVKVAVLPPVKPPDCGTTRVCVLDSAPRGDAARSPRHHTSPVASSPRKRGPIQPRPRWRLARAAQAARIPGLRSARNDGLWPCFSESPERNPTLRLTRPLRAGQNRKAVLGRGRVAGAGLWPVRTCSKQERPGFAKANPAPKTLKAFSTRPQGAG
ncbi:hypothetical protein QO014_003484 [Kaistia dalseonensis]|uniref:Uncharacterized protein n=1 Tax=Kaistia dalseonensis TaxID=410840 RepID=A0ABU0H9T6_9HYPH|nr:hypothetical protein [Kaistia dalseonensis]